MQPVISAEAWQAEEIFLVYVQKALRPQRDETEASCRVRTDEASALLRNPTCFASHVAHQNVRQNRFAITVQQLHIRVTDYIKRSTGVALYGQKKYNSGVKKMEREYVHA